MLRARLGRMMLSRTLMQLQGSRSGVGGGASGAAAAHASTSATAAAGHSHRLLLGAGRSTALRQAPQLQQPCQLHALAAVREHLPSASSSASRRALHSSRVATAASADVFNQPGVITEMTQYTPEPAVYTAEYDAQYANYHCITGCIKNIKEHEIGDNYWATFTVQVAPLVGVVDDYNCYIGGDPSHMANAVLLARDLVRLMQEGDQVQVGGAMVLDGNRPKVFAHSIGKLQPLAPGAVVQTMEMPALPEHIMAVAFSGPLPVVTNTPPPAPRAAAAAAAPAPAAAAAAAAASPQGPINPPGMPAVASFPKEALWISLFQEHHLWIDQRTSKTGRQPDFKMRRAPELGQQTPALWLDDYAPAWVKDSLHLLPEQAPAVDPALLPAYIPRSAAFSGYEVERHWVSLFTSPKDFWDNRAAKTNPRAPDFKLKDKEQNVALWIDSRGTPSWVLANLDKLPPAAATRGRDLLSSRACDEERPLLT